MKRWEDIEWPDLIGAGWGLCKRPPLTPLHIELGAELRRLRKKRGVSMREMARRLKVSAPYLSDVELGRRACSVKRAEAYVRELMKR